MFQSKNKKKNVYPCKPQFYYVKVGCKEVYITWTFYHDVYLMCVKPISISVNVAESQLLGTRDMCNVIILLYLSCF